MGVAAAEGFGVDHLPRRHLHQRWAAEEDGALVLHDDRLIRHGGHIGAACGAAAHHAGDLRDALRAHIGLIEEDPPEMLAIRKNLILIGQVRAAAVHQINAGEVILLRDLLRAQMLFHRHRVIGAAFHGGIVADDHHLAPGDAPYPGDHPRRGRSAVVHAVRRRRADLQKRRAWVEEARDPVAGEQLAARHMAGAGPFATAQRSGFDGGLNHLHRFQMGLPVRREGGIAGGNLRGQLHCEYSR